MITKLYEPAISSFYDSQNKIDALSSSSTRKILDPIHDFIIFDQYIWDFVDTPEFQRLRELKQNGLTYLVFQGATHTRFEHSIGTAFLAQKFSKNILKHQSSLINGSEEYKNTLQRDITLAGLCHDLGHGPFSHLFDNVIIKTLNPSSNWSHEDASLTLLDKLIDDNHIEIEDDSRKRIKYLIKGDIEQSTDPNWIFDIIANKRNSIDVDKFDYMTRDSYYLGLKDTYFDYRAIMKEARVINDEICYPAKMAFKIYELFQARYKLHKNIYTNRVTCCLDMMMRDIFIEANPHYNFVKIIEDPSQYMYLTDYIVQEIERSNDPSLEISRELINRIKRRDLYKYVSEILLTENLSENFDKSKIEQDIISYQPYDGILPTITVNDIHVTLSCINYAKKDQNPVDCVKFFHKNNLESSFQIAKEEVSLLLPSKFQEKFLRIFVKKQIFFPTALKAFENYCEKVFKLKIGPVLGVPSPSPKKILDKKSIDKRRPEEYH